MDNNLKYLISGLMVYWGLIHSLQVAKQVVNGRLLLCFHDVVSVGCEQQALQPLSPAVVSASAFRAVNHGVKNCFRGWFLNGEVRPIAW